ncbi:MULTISPECIES: recombinase RecT [unclassified Streptomyces]|uniref:recombinase RecT n=1 Tax=unclassified Streptomyces TaxID=2593676 RepID=UPI00037A33A3|nr:MULTISPECIES: recombinase RecT [unclassified Streptomyces]MYX33458.1 recombinase RecT [Streptomyces sp. SID8377]
MTTSLKDRVRSATTANPQRITARSLTPEGIIPAQQADDPHAAQTAMDFLRRYEQHFAEALPAHVDRDNFFAAVRAGLPPLGRCSPASVLQALLACARFGLVPDGRRAAIVADEGLAVFVPMYQGYIELMHLSGQIDSVRVGLIYEGDEWHYEPSAPPPDDFTHKARVELPREQRGEPILAYAFCWMKGGARSQVIVLSREDAEQIRHEHSRAYQRAQESGRLDSFWHLRFDDMWTKSAIRRLPKYVPMSPELAALAAADDAGDTGSPQILHAPPATREAAWIAARQDAEAEAPQVPLRRVSESRTVLVKRNTLRRRAIRKGRR